MTPRVLPQRAGRGPRFTLCALALALASQVAWLARADGAASRAATSVAQLPRVFFTPAERARLSAARLAGRPLPAAAAVEVPPAPVTGIAVPPGANDAGANGAPREPAAPVRSARLEGVTLGRGATAAVWIGGERIVDGGRWGRWRVQVRRDGARLRAPDGTVREVRVGMELQP